MRQALQEEPGRSGWQREQGGRKTQGSRGAARLSSHSALSGRNPDTASPSGRGRRRQGEASRGSSIHTSAGDGAGRASGSRLHLRHSGGSEGRRTRAPQACVQHRDVPGFPSSRLPSDASSAPSTHRGRSSEEEEETGSESSVRSSRASGPGAGDALGARTGPASPCPPRAPCSVRPRGPSRSDPGDATHLCLSGTAFRQD